MNLSKNFAYWLSVQGSPGILPNQVKATVNIIRNLPEADLISVMYYGSDELACSAIKELKLRFEDEMNFLDEVAQDQQRHHERERDETDWN